MKMLKKENGIDKRGSMNIKVENDFFQTQISRLQKHTKVLSSDMDVNKFATTRHTKIDLSNF